MRAELAAKAGGDADTAFEAERQRLGDEKRAELEAQLAAAATEAEAAAAAAEVSLSSWYLLVCLDSNLHLKLMLCIVQLFCSICCNFWAPARQACR